MSNAINYQPLTQHNQANTTTLGTLYKATNSNGETVFFDADTDTTARCYATMKGFNNVRLAEPETIADFYND